MGQGKYQIEVDKHLPNDIYTRLCFVFVQAEAGNDWRRLLPYCAANISIVDYGNGTYNGQTSIVLGDYWRMAKVGNNFTDCDYWIHTARFYARAVVLVQMINKQIRYITFRVQDGLVTHIVIFPCTIEESVSLEYNPMAKLPFRTEYLDSVCGEDTAPKANHLPCMVCGALSETLLWRKITLYPKQNITLEGEVSVCPHCQRQAELHISKQIPAEPKKNEDDEGLPF